MPFEPLDARKVAEDITRRQWGSKWGHPKYSAHLTSQEMRTLCDTVLKNAPLRELCVKFIADHRISQAGCIVQNDKVIEHAYGFIQGICEIVGYHKRPEGEV